MKIFIIILSASIILTVIYILFRIIGYRMEIKRDRKRDKMVGKIIELDEFERKLSDDPARPEPMHPRDWEAFNYPNNVNV